MKLNPNFFALLGWFAIIGTVFGVQQCRVNQAEDKTVAVLDSAGTAAKNVIDRVSREKADEAARAERCEKEAAQVRSYYQDALLNQKAKTDAVKASLASLSADRIVGEAAKTLPGVAADSARYQGRLSRADSLVALRVLEQGKALQAATEQNTALLNLRAQDQLTIENATARQQHAVTALFDARAQTQEELTKATGPFRRGRRKALLRVDARLAEGVEKVGR